MKIQKVSNIVKEILERNKATRDNDNLLYVEVIYAIKPEVVNSNFRYVLSNANFLGLPPFETVSRCRRKLQKEYPELKASDKVEKIRTEKQEEYIEYSRQKESVTVGTVAPSELTQTL
jgi:hypothetical protein